MTGLKEVVLLGTGASDAIPYIACVLGLSNSSPCSACKLAQKPWDKHNKRRQTSVLVKIQDGHGVQRNILIDCGPMFTDLASLLKRHKVRRLDAVLLTRQFAVKVPLP